MVDADGVVPGGGAGRRGDGCTVFGVAADRGRDQGRQSQLTWIVDGYTLILACLVLPAGAVG